MFAKTDIIHRGADVQFLIPYGYGADADGQYVRAVCTVLDRSGHCDTAIAAPILEELPQHAADPDLLLRAVLTGDVLYAALADMRAQLAPQAIPTWEELTRLAAQISALPPAAEIVWRPWEARCVSPRSTRGFWTPSSARAIRSPVYPSARCFGCSGATTAPPHRSSSSAGRSGSRSSPAPSAAPGPSAPIPRSSSRRPTAASRTSRAISAATAMPRRWSSARTPTRCSTTCRAMNTAVVLELIGLSEQCPAPLFDLSLAGDWDESAWARLRSFLYYC